MFVSIPKFRISRHLNYAVNYSALNTYTNSIQYMLWFALYINNSVKFENKHFILNRILNMQMLADFRCSQPFGIIVIKNSSRQLTNSQHANKTTIREAKLKKKKQHTLSHSVFHSINENR